MRSIESESADEPLVERVAEEIIQRQRAGEKPTVEEYCARYPDAAEQLRSFLPAILVVEGLKPNSKDQSGSFGSTLEIAGTQKAVIGDYRILSELGRGGMGVVYEAEQQSLGRRVALKVLQRPSSSARKMERRFESEARAAARMHHTNIVPVFDVGSDERHLYYAMQLIQGQSLDLVINDLRNIRSRRSSDSNRSKPPGSDDHHIARSLLTGQFRKDDLADGQNRGVDFDHPSQAIELTETTAVPSSSATSAVLPGHSDLSSAEDNRAAYFLSVAKIGHQTAEALSYAHTRGIIHRDIKPSNLLLDGNGTVWITDFGLAKSGDTDMTHTGDILGTLRYMSPERFKGQCDVRADVYALGLTLYELLVLKLAFDSPDRLTLIEMVSRAELETPRSIDPKIPRDLETIVLKACDQDPKRRYQSADDLADDLQRFIDDEPIQARRASLLERSARWSRHNPWLAASVSIATVALVLIAILSSYAAAVQNRLNNDLSFANSQKDSLLTEQKTLNEELEKTSAQRESMIGELRQSQSRLAEMQAEFVSEKGRFGESMLWLARAYESTDQSDENSRGRLLGKLAVAAQKTPRLLQEYYLHPSNAERSEVILQARDRSGDRSPMIEMLKNGSTVRDAVVSPDQSLVVTRQMQRDPSSESAHEDSSADQGPNGTMRSLWKVWDVERSEYTGQQLLTGDASNLSIAVNAPNRLLAIGELELDPPQPNRRTFEETIRLDGEEKTFTISVWDIDSGKRLFTPIQLSVQSGNTPVSRMPPQVAFRSGGEEMVVAYAKVTNQPRRGAPIFAERFHSRSGKLIESVVIASRGQPIGPGPALFDLSDDGTRLTLIPRNLSNVLNRAYLGARGQIQVYDVESGKPVGEAITIERQEAFQVASRAAGCFALISGTAGNRSVGLIDVQTGDPTGELITIKDNGRSTFRIVNASIEANRVVVQAQETEEATVSFDSSQQQNRPSDPSSSAGETTVQIFDSSSGKQLSPPLPVRGRVLAAPISRDGKRWTIWDEKGVRIWELATTAPLETLLPTQVTIPQRRMGDLAGFFNFLRKSSTDQDGGSSRLSFLQSMLTRDHGAIVFDRNQRLRMAWSRGKSQQDEVVVASWDNSSGELIREQILPYSSNLRIDCFSPGGDFLLTSDCSAVLDGQPELMTKVWRTDSGQLHGEPIALGLNVIPASLSPDGGRIIVIEKASTDVPNGQAAEQDQNSSRARPTAATPGVSRGRRGGLTPQPPLRGRLLVIDRQTGQRTPLEFPLPRGTQSSELTIPSSIALQAQFTADGQAIVVRIGRNVHLFDSGGRWLRRIRLNRAGADDDRRLSSSEVTRDATIIAVTKEESILELYSLLDGELIGAPLVHPALIARIAFDFGGTTVATASADGLVRFWALPGRWPDDVDEISQRIAAHTGMALSRSGEVLHREFTNQSVGQSVWTAVAEHQRQQHSSLVTGALDALARQGFSDAQIGLEKCVQRYPNQWQYRLLQIRPLVEQGRIDEAEKIVEVVRRQIGDATVRLWLEKNLHQLGIKADQGPYDDDFARQLVWHREQLIKVQPSEVFRQALLFELINEDENSFSPHEQLAYLNEFLELRASEPQMLIRRAALLERLHRWDEAIRDYKRVAELDPDQHFHQYRLLALYLFVDDQESFLSTWQQMFDKWADTTEKRIPERLAKPALLLGRDNEGLQFALKLADRAFKERHKEERYEAYDLVAKGFAEYRRGDFQSAINYLNESIAIFESGVNPYAPALNYFFVAMAQHQLGSTDAALESYQTGVDRNETYYDYIVNNSNFMVDWLFAETARRQAASVLGIELDQAIFPVPPLPETESWVTLFEDNFDRNDLGDDWSEEEAWSIEDGAIRGQVGLGKSSRGRRYDTTIELLGHEVPRVAEITYQTWWSQPLLSELKIASDEYPSYVVGLSGVTHLYRTPFGESGKGPHLRDYFVIGKRRDGSDILGARWTAIRPNIELPAGQHYQIRIVQQPEHVRVFIDDEEVISERITAQTGRTLILYGNGPADASVYFDNLRIRTPAPSSKRSD